MIRALGPEPRPVGARKLAGADDLWRLRVRIDDEHWRIVYQLRPRERPVIVLRVVPRNEATHRRLR